MTIDSLSNALKATDLSRSSRDKSRGVKPIEDDKPSSASSKVEIIRAGSAKAFAQADSFNQNSANQTGSTFSEKSAIDAYQSIAKDQQREGLQLLLGVDTFV
ncbi:MAG: hypothetical protein ABJH06_14255 [Paraglaciecola sp.]|uniref:hypothetical protein n=1 Tax=Paraglaciecola sp. TaxID=1920173 RepID=UPI003264A19A